MHLRPTEHLENCRPKCKMHTQERQLTRFCLQLIYKENRTEPAVFLKTELEKSILHIPNIHNSQNDVDTTGLLDNWPVIQDSYSTYCTL